jgi:hypothetical protein
VAMQRVPSTFFDLQPRPRSVAVGGGDDKLALFGRPLAFA